MSNSEKTVNLYCDIDRDEIQHIANHLENAGIDFQITGDTSTTVLGGYNPTQEVCIRVFETDFVKAKRIIEQFSTDSNE